MPNQKNAITATAPRGALAVPDWHAGGALTAAGLRVEQEYQVQRLRRHLRLVHGWGVVCGLNVVSAGDADGVEFFICPGYGIGPCGDEILVAERYRFTLRDFLWTQPLGLSVDWVWIGIDATEDAVAWRPAPAAPCGCDCDDAREQVSRRADGFRVVVWWTEPKIATSGSNVCGGTGSCPKCPESCALPLAGIALPSSIRKG
jgi:hypothetical protein